MTAVADHLWQSTWFALAAGMIALFVRNDAARVRYWVWCAASLKFLFPFALLNWVGNQFIVQVEDETALLPIVQHAATPLAAATASMVHVGKEVQQVVIALWILGSVALLGRWLLTWLHSRAMQHSSTSCAVIAPIPVRCSDQLDAPCVVGVVEPVLLLPSHLLSSLTPAQMDAVIAHEMWHVRRRDNLTAGLHLLVEALFWFHPLVWWLGAKLVLEREQACDAGALEDGNEPELYAETLLKICRQSVESRLACVASAIGGDLTLRIRAIMLQRPNSRLSGMRRTVLTSAFVGCLALPVASGMTVVMTSAVTVPAGAYSIRTTDAAGPAFVVVRDDYIYGRNVSLRELIGRAYSVRDREVSGNTPLLDHPRFDVDLSSRTSSPRDHRQAIADLLKKQFNVELIVRPTPGRARF